MFTLKAVATLKLHEFIRFFTSQLKSQAQFPIQAPSGKLLLPLVGVQLCSAQRSPGLHIVMAHQLGARLEMRQIFRPLGPLRQKNGQMLGQPVKSQTEPGQIHGTWMSIWGLPKNLPRDFHKASHHNPKPDDIRQLNPSGHRIQLIQ